VGGTATAYKEHNSPPPCFAPKNKESAWRWWCFWNIPHRGAM